MEVFKRILGFKYLSIFLAALFLKFFLAPFFFHTDIKIIYDYGQFLSQGVWNIYDFLASNKQEAPFGQFVYPPLTYFISGIFYLVISPLAGMDYSQWLKSTGDAMYSPYIFRYLFLMKIPLIFFEVLTGFLLIKLIRDEKKKQISLILWFFNPINIYVVSIMGQFDIIPAFLTVLALYFASKEKMYLAAIAIGLGAAMKTYPLLLLPFLALSSKKSWFHTIKVFLLGLVPYLVFTLPVLGSKPYHDSVLVSGLSMRIFFLNFSLGFDELILVVFFALFVLLFHAAERKFEKKVVNLPAYFLAVILVVLSGSHFHPQWLIWSTPFLAILVFKKNLVLPFIGIIVGWLGVFSLFDDKFLTLGLLTPLDQGLLFLPTIRDFSKLLFDPVMLQSTFHTLLAASSIWVIYLTLFKGVNEHE